MRRAPAAAALLLLAGCGATQNSTSTISVADHLREPLKVEVDSEVWSFGAAPGKRILTPSYRIMTTETNPVLVGRFPVFLEMALAHYSRSLTTLPRPTERMDTYLMSGRAQWDKLTIELMGADASTFLRIERGGYAHNGIAVLYDIGTRDTFAIAAHEGWHQFTQSTFRQPLPVWLDEGIASYMEGYRWDPSVPDRPLFLPWSNAERFDQLRRAYRGGTLVPLRRLLQQRPQDLISAGGDQALTYYAQVWALTLFLSEYDGGRYRPGLEMLLVDSSRGLMISRVAELLGTGSARRATSRRGPDVFIAYFDADLDSASAAYAEFIERVVTTAQKHLINDGHSPINAPG